MKRFKDFELTGPADHLTQIIQSISARLPHGWHRDKEAEQRLAEMTAAGENTGYAFSRDPGQGMPAAGLFIASDKRRLYISNIVPRESGSLSMDQYNHIVDEFADITQEAAKGDSFVTIKKSSDSAEITDWVSEHAAELLRRFSVLANKSTGASHPKDRQRWNTFLIAVHKERSRLHSGELERWLMEDGWSEDRAFELAIEYELARALLSEYDESR